MKIDTHQHYWRYSAVEFAWIADDMTALRQDLLPNDVMPSMKGCDIDGVVAVQARSCVQETEFLLELAHANAHILGVVGWVDLASQDLSDQLDAWSGQRALKGFRHILQDEAEPSRVLSDQAFNRGIAELQSRKLAYDVLVYDHQLPVVLDFCSRHDKHWLVLDHLGKPCIRDWRTRPEVSARWATCINALGAMPHVMCKLSGLVTETNWASGKSSISAAECEVMFECFDRALEAFGPTRLMFGSDWPVCNLAAPYERVHTIVQRWVSKRFTEREQNAFWYANAVRCYSLDTMAV